MKNSDQVLVELSKLEQASKRSIPAVALGLLFVVSSSIYSVYKLEQTANELAQRQTEINTAIREKGKLESAATRDRKDIASLDDTKKRLNNEISLLQKKLTEAKVTLAQAGQPAAAQDIGAVVAESVKNTSKIENKAVNIDLEVPKDDPIDSMAKAIADEFVQDGYTIGQTTFAKSAPDGVEVRYYHNPDDKDLAGELLKTLQSKFGISAGRTSYVIDPDQPRQSIQISFPRGLKLSTPAPKAE